jgi:hypothetical protein
MQIKRQSTYIELTKMTACRETQSSLSTHTHTEKKRNSSIFPGSFSIADCT